MDISMLIIGIGRNKTLKKKKQKKNIIATCENSKNDDCVEK